MDEQMIALIRGKLVGRIAAAAALRETEFRAAAEQHEAAIADAHQVFGEEVTAAWREYDAKMIASCTAGLPTDSIECPKHPGKFGDH